MSGATLPEPTWNMTVKTFGAKGAAEFVYLVGVYALVSVILNGFDVPVPDAT
jgi:4-carboxymuconolactone decarboxylase